MGWPPPEGMFVTKQRPTEYEKIIDGLFDDDTEVPPDDAIVVTREYLRNQQTRSSLDMYQLHGGPATQVRWTERVATGELRHHAQRLDAVLASDPEITWTCTVTASAYPRPEGITNEQWDEIKRMISDVPRERLRDSIVVHTKADLGEDEA